MFQIVSNNAFSKLHTTGCKFLVSVHCSGQQRVKTSLFQLTRKNDFKNRGNAFRFSSSSSQQNPGNEINQHTVVFGVLMLPVVLAAIYFSRTSPDQDYTEQQIRKLYPHEAHKVKEREEAFAQFYKTAILGEGTKAEMDEMNKKITETLKAGKGEKKRIHNTDTDLQEIDSKTHHDASDTDKKEEPVKKRKRKKRVENIPTETEAAEKNEVAKSTKEVIVEPNESENKQAATATGRGILAVAVVGSIAVISGLISGGRRS